MIPRPLLVILAVALGIGGAIVALAPSLGTAWLVLAGTLVVVAAVDLLSSLRRAVPPVARNLPGSVSLMTWISIDLEIDNAAGRRTLLLEAFDHHPATFRADALPVKLAIPAGRSATATYRARPTERGPADFPGCELRIASPLRLWWRRRFSPVQSSVRVYPNYSTISKLLHYEVENRLQLAGVRLSRRRGEGIEFHQLRDYRDGDALRTIDWKATARIGRLISREYQDERDQQIIFILDAGRRMLAKDGDLSHFDHALNAMLLLSFVALRQGDAAGILSVGIDRTWLPPRKGADAINGLLNHVYDVQPQPVEIDYIAAATDLRTRQRRRSLVVILTNAREEDSEDLQLAVDLLKRKHLVILASLRERAIDDVLSRRVENFEDALLCAAANQYLDARRESHRLLSAKGVFVEDCLSDELPSAITNRYLAIKRAGVL